MAIPLLTDCDIAGRDITADALLTQRALAAHIVARGAPDFSEQQTLAHGRIERRRLWCTTALNDYLDVPHVGQCFLIERETIVKKTGEQTSVFAYGLTSRSPEQASPERLLKRNRGHWTIEAVHHVLDWNYDEDRSRIRTGYGPENMTRLRRFAVGVLRDPQAQPVHRPDDAPALLPTAHGAGLSAPDHQCVWRVEGDGVRTNLPWATPPGATSGHQAW